MDREALRRAAASRRNDVVVTKPKAVTWHCEFCLRDFQTENGFMNHHCADRERLEEMKSPRGIAAYAYYSEWMRLHKRSVPAADRFMTSRQYNYFIKFVDWAEKTAIPNPNQFIKVMVDTSTQPVLWCRDTTYAMYLQWYDNAYPPLEQFIETYDRLVVRAQDYGVPVSEVYQAIGAKDIARLVRRRKLSPWLLVVSQKFLKWVQALPPTEKEMISEAINFGAYAAKLNQNPELARELRAACEAENV
jgi:hypothetical protein